MRLIDADKLILHLNDYALQEAPFRGESADVYDAIENCIKAIEEQPTAYDMEKVVEKLENQSKEYNSGVRLHGKSEEMLTDDAIEIVKAGGKNDD
jgi:hypothetical protein